MALDPDIARVLGLNPNDNRHALARNALHQATGDAEHLFADIDDQVAAAMAAIVEELIAYVWDRHSIDPVAATRAITGRAVHAAEPVAVLAYLNPSRIIPAGPVGKLDQVCRRLLRPELERVVAGLITEWVSAGHITRRAAA